MRELAAASAKSAFLIALFSLAANVAQAGSSAGTVTVLRAHTSAPNIVTFVAGANATRPACSSQGNEWALSLTTEGGRAMYAMLLMAMASGRTITVSGTGACTSWPDRETPGYISVEP